MQSKLTQADGNEVRQDYEPDNAHQNGQSYYSAVNLFPTLVHEDIFSMPSNTLDIWTKIHKNENVSEYLSHTDVPMEIRHKIHEFFKPYDIALKIRADDPRINGIEVLTPGEERQRHMELYSKKFPNTPVDWTHNRVKNARASSDKFAKSRARPKRSGLSPEPSNPKNR